MSSIDEILGQEVVLDEEAFTKAARNMTELAGKMDGLRNRISGLLAELQKGFQTPAGEKFFKACGSTLLQPLDDQKRVINHVSENLTIAQQSYQSVFQEFEKLNRQIEKINQ